MKKIVLFTSLAVLAISITSCDTGTTVEPTISQLYGSWQWISSQGGFGGELRTPQSTSETRKAIFRADGIVQFFKNNILVNQLRFTVNRESNPNGNEYYVIRYLDTSYYVPDQTISFDGLDTLYLADTCMDCYRNVYSRLR
jgi:hypothetical protein